MEFAAVASFNPAFFAGTATASLFCVLLPHPLLLLLLRELLLPFEMQREIYFRSIMEEKGEATERERERERGREGHIANKKVRHGTKPASAERGEGI